MSQRRAPIFSDPASIVNTRRTQLNNSYPSQNNPSSFQGYPVSPSPQRQSGRVNPGPAQNANSQARYSFKRNSQLNGLNHNSGTLTSSDVINYQPNFAPNQEPRYNNTPIQQNQVVLQQQISKGFSNVIMTSPVNSPMNQTNFFQQRPINPPPLIENTQVINQHPTHIPLQIQSQNKNIKFGYISNSPAPALVQTPTNNNFIPTNQFIPNNPIPVNNPVLLNNNQLVNNNLALGNLAAVNNSLVIDGNLASNSARARAQEQLQINNSYSNNNFINKVPSNEQISRPLASSSSNVDVDRLKATIQELQLERTQLLERIRKQEANHELIETNRREAIAVYKKQIERLESQLGQIATSHSISEEGDRKQQNRRLRQEVQKQKDTIQLHQNTIQQLRFKIQSNQYSQSPKNEKDSSSSSQIQQLQNTIESYSQQVELMYSQQETYKRTIEANQRAIQQLTNRESENQTSEYASLKEQFIKLKQHFNEVTHKYEEISQKYSRTQAVLQQTQEQILLIQQHQETNTVSQSQQALRAKSQAEKAILLQEIQRLQLVLKEKQDYLGKAEQYIAQLENKQSKQAKPSSQTQISSQSVKSTSEPTANEQQMSNLIKKFQQGQIHHAQQLISLEERYRVVVAQLEKRVIELNEEKKGLAMKMAAMASESVNAGSSANADPVKSTKFQLLECENIELKKQLNEVNEKYRLSRDSASSSSNSTVAQLKESVEKYEKLYKSSEKNLEEYQDHLQKAEAHILYQEEQQKTLQKRVIELQSQRENILREFEEIKQDRDSYFDALRIAEDHILSIETQAH